MCGLLALGLAACSAEEPMNPGVSPEPTPGQKDVYASLTVKLPGASTRSMESQDDEVGQDYENNVGKILVVLATYSETDKEYKYLTMAESDAKPNSSDVPAGQVKYVLNFSSQEMSPNPLDKEEDGATVPESDVYVFVYCNPSAELLGMFYDSTLTTGSSFTNLVGTILDKDNAVMWKKNNFLMTNWKIKETPVKIPKRDDLINNHGTPESAFNLGTVQVKRAAARFDFMPTSTALGENVYEIKDIDGETVVGKVELTEMAMFNIAKRFYYLPRTSSTWTWDNIELCSGKEEEDFVVSYSRSFKQPQSGILNNNVGTNFYSYIVGNQLDGSGENGLEWVNIKNWYNNAQDDNADWTMTEGGDHIASAYKIWRYTTENTIPAQKADGSSSTSSQKVGITTGVVFKGVFTPTTDASKARWNGKDAVYVHNNVVFGNFDKLKKYVVDNPSSLVAEAFKGIDKFKNVPADFDHSKSLLEGVDDDKLNGFKVYVPTDGKYFMYYFYYNRHNSNGKPSVMGVDEFGVVRNNVYKLKVTSCGTFGEPGAPTKPNDPNEQENAYFTVSCYVLPWTVRVNNIEF